MREAPPDPLRLPRYRPRVLVVEDDPMSQDMLVRRLASRGFRVASASDGESCLKQLSAAAAAGPGAPEPPDLVLLDVNLPGASGVEVVREIRGALHFSHDMLPVILVTALGGTEDVVGGLEAGANDYVVKPIDFPVLLARVQVCLRVKQGVMLLMEAERQRVLVQALGEACHQLAQPLTAVMMTLEALIRRPPGDPAELAEQLNDVLRWTRDAGEVLNRMRKVGTMQQVSYTRRMEQFDEGSQGQGTPRTREQPWL